MHDLGRVNLVNYATSFSVGEWLTILFITAGLWLAAAYGGRLGLVIPLCMIAACAEAIGRLANRVQDLEEFIAERLVTQDGELRLDLRPGSQQ